MTAWNDTFDGDTDFFDQATAQMFITAINERWRGRYNSDLFDVPDVADGDALGAIIYRDYSIADMAIANATGDTDDSLEDAEAAALSAPSEWVATRIGEVGDVTSYEDIDPQGGWTGFDNLFFWSFHGEHPTIVHGIESMNHQKFLRLRYRRFNDFDATEYDDGTVVEDGHKAANIVTFRNYERVAGEWVILPFGSQPDIVQRFGMPKAGDIIHVNLFTQFRDVLNACRVLAAEAIFQLNDAVVLNEVYASNAAPGATWAATQADMEADFGTDNAGELAHMNNTDGYPLMTYTGAYVESSPGVFGYNCTAFTRKNRAVAVMSLQTQYSAALHYYASADDETFEFDDNGSGVVEGALAYFSSASKAELDDNAISGYLGSNILPAEPDEPTALMDNTSRGWRVTILPPILLQELTGFSKRPL